MTKKSKITAIDFAVTVENFKINQITQFIKNQIIEWKQYDFTDDNLWKTFLKNFDDYTEIDFLFDNKNAVRQLRICLRSRDVWIKTKSKILLHRALINTLKKKESTKWTKKKLKKCHIQEKFVSDEIKKFIAWIINNSIIETIEIENDVDELEFQTPQHEIERWKKYRRVSMFSDFSTSKRKQKRSSVSQQSKQQSKHQQPRQQSKRRRQQNERQHQHKNQSNKQSKQQRQQNERQHQQSVQLQQPRMQSIEQQSFSFDEISFWAFSVFSKSLAFKASENHDRVLFNLAKMYSDETKYSDENNSWNFKFIIFHDMCARAEVFETVKLMTFSIIFKNLTLNYYYFNVTV